MYVVLLHSNGACRVIKIIKNTYIHAYTLEYIRTYTYIHPYTYIYIHTNIHTY